MAMAIIENIKGNQIVEDLGDRVIIPGENIIFGMHNRPGSVQISITSNASYMISITQAKKIKVENNTAVFLPLSSEDLTESSDFYVKYGGFIKIENRNTSAGNITVDWRV